MLICNSARHCKFDWQHNLHKLQIFLNIWCEFRRQEETVSPNVFEMEKAYLPSNWGKSVASGIIYSLFHDYDQPKLSLAVSNMIVTCGYYGWLECHRPALRLARSTPNRKCYSTRLSNSQGLLRVSVEFRY